MTEPSNRSQPPAEDSEDSSASDQSPDVSQPTASSQGNETKASPAETTPPPPPGYGPPPGYSQPYGPPQGFQPGYGQYSYPPQGPGGYGNVPPPIPGQLPVPGGYGILPPNARRSSKKGWIIGLSITAVVLVLCCGCTALAGFGIYRVVESVRDQAGESTQDYLEALRDQRFDDAYELMCDRNKNRDGQTREEFIAAQQESPKLLNYEVQGVAVSQEGSSEFKVKTEQEFDDGTSRIERIPVVSEGDELRPCP